MTSTHAPNEPKDWTLTGRWKCSGWMGRRRALLWVFATGGDGHAGSLDGRHDRPAAEGTSGYRMQGPRALAVIYGLLEAEVERWLVTMDEVLSGKVSGYQREINESL